MVFWLCPTDPLLISRLFVRLALYPLGYKIFLEASRQV